MATNITFVENLINHPSFQAMDYTTRFIDDTPELFEFPKRRDRATRLLRYIADVNVNGQREASGRPKPPRHVGSPVPPTFLADAAQTPETAKAILDNQGPRAVADWMLAQKALLVTDTTMRDAHQSLLATRVRTYDLAAVAPAYDSHLRGLFSLECWGGATFDVAMRFLDECPWDRIRTLRQALPGHMLQMLFRGSNGVGYTSYPDNVVEEFIRQSAESGIDVFRVFDSLNWVENMRVAIDAVGTSGKLCEGAICYTGDLLDKTRGTYNLDYYLKMAGELKQAGVHVISLKDMAGLLKPAAASVLIPALKQETGLPVHLHTHDTSGISAATVLAAAEAGVDAADAAMDSLSGLTSQPNLGSLVEALQNTERETGLSSSHIRAFSDYWEQVRDQYAAFEPDMRAGASEVYLHEMPGGQFTNLKEQARSLGLANKWHEVAKTYADVNAMFGDIIKVTPSSKMVGDMALMMVSAGLTREDVEDPAREISFPESVVAFFSGDLGQPPNGFPEGLQTKVLKGKTPSLTRPGADLPPADLKALRKDAEKVADRRVSQEEMNSFAMYPSDFKDYVARRREFGPMDVIPTLNFFYGMEPGAEIGVDLEPGKRLHIRCQTIGEVDDEGNRRVFFELNGQPRSIRVPDRSVVGELVSHPKADPGNANHLPAPMPGLVSSVAVSEGQSVNEGDVLLTIEAMKMETSIHADRDGIIKAVVAPAGTQIDAKDLLLEFA